MYTILPRICLDSCPSTFPVSTLPPGAILVEISHRKEGDSLCLSVNFSNTTLPKFYYDAPYNEIWVEYDANI